MMNEQYHNAIEIPMLYSNSTCEDDDFPQQDTSHGRVSSQQQYDVLLNEDNQQHSPVMNNVNSSPLIRPAHKKRVTAMASVNKNNNRNLITSSNTSILKPVATASINLIHDHSNDIKQQCGGERKSASKAKKGVPYEQNLLRYLQFHKAALLAVANSSFAQHPRSSFSHGGGGCGNSSTSNHEDSQAYIKRQQQFH